MFGFRRLLAVGFCLSLLDDTTQIVVGSLDYTLCYSYCCCYICPLMVDGKRRNGTAYNEYFLQTTGVVLSRRGALAKLKAGQLQYCFLYKSKSASGCLLLFTFSLQRRVLASETASRLPAKSPWKADSRLHFFVKLVSTGSALTLRS